MPARESALVTVGLFAALACCGDNIPSRDGSIVIACEIGAPIAEVPCIDACSSGQCVDGVCRETCELHAGVPTCDRATTCVERTDLALATGTGICEPTCDPLTQCTRMSATPEACDSVDATSPDRVCAGVSEFTCRASTSTARDREAASNGACAPGYVALLVERTGSSTLICAGLCAALEVDNTPAHAGNALGDPTAAAKLVGQPHARVGDATCAVGAKGSAPSSTCRFLWPLLDGAIPASFALRYLDTLGVCVAIAEYRYDSDGDGVEDTPYPSCTTLPPRSAATPGRFDDAYDWGCQKRASGATSLELRLAR